MMRGVVRRAGWGFFDQTLSSLTNFGLGIVVAATVSARQFGAFSLVYAVYGLVLGLSEGFASTPLTIRFSTREGDEFADAERKSVGSALAIGIVSGGACLVVSPLMTPVLSGPLRALGVMLPGLLVQDAWRFAFVSRRRPPMAAANDGVWAVLQVVGIVALAASHSISATTMVVVWGGSATVAAMLGCLQGGGVWPAPGNWRPWLQSQRDLGPRYALETIAHRSGGYLVLFAVGGIAGLRAAGDLRGAVLLMTGPLNLLLLGAGFVAVPEGVRLYEEAPQKLAPAARWYAAVVAAVAALWALTILGLAHRIGPRILGSTWTGARPLLPVLAAYAVLQALAIGPGTGLWVLAAAKRSLRIQTTGVIIVVVAASVGTALDGVHGAAVAIAATTALVTGLWWWQFQRAYSLAGDGAAAGIEPGPSTAGAALV
jgi:O-antigen/teichoic acid export membrane protein